MLNKIFISISKPGTFRASVFGASRKEITVGGDRWFSSDIDILLKSKIIFLCEAFLYRILCNYFSFNSSSSVIVTHGNDVFTITRGGSNER